MMGMTMVLLVLLNEQGKEMNIVVGTDIREGNGTTRMVNWCGCIIQDPHPAVRALGFLPEEGHGVYVARYAIIIVAFQGRL
jgi:pro-apoptotic serine protease NMA111